MLPNKRIDVAEHPQSKHRNRREYMAVSHAFSAISAFIGIMTCRPSMEYCRLLASYDVAIGITSSGAYLSACPCIASAT